MKFREFQKIPRLNREVVITEKIDGTNGLVHVEQVEMLAGVESPPPVMPVEYQGMQFVVAAGSRSRYISPFDDNHGFARWVWDNANELVKLGPGQHYGEWWGSGIQRGYGLKEKRFSLFNVHRWGESRPACCHVVPVLYRGPFETDQVHGTLIQLQEHGSYAAPGFMKPEGVIVYHTAANALFKATIEKDEEPKSKGKA